MRQQSKTKWRWLLTGCSDDYKVSHCEAPTGVQSLETCVSQQNEREISLSRGTEESEGFVSPQRLWCQGQEAGRGLLPTWEVMSSGASPMSKPPPPEGLQKTSQQQRYGQLGSQTNSESKLSLRGWIHIWFKILPERRFLIRLEHDPYQKEVYFH